MNLLLMTAGSLRLGFHPDTALPVSLRSTRTGTEYLGACAQPFFALDIKKNGCHQTLTGQDAVATGYAWSGDDLVLYYHFLGRNNISVACTVHSGGDELQFSFHLQQTGFEVVRVDYPILRLPKALVPGEDWVLYHHPFKNGMLIHGFENAPQQAELAFSDGHTNPVQMTACGIKNETLYLATNDTGHHARYLLPRAMDSGLSLESAYYPEDRHAPRIEAPYRAILSLLPEGEWYAAAEKFRAWAKERPYLAKRLDEREDVPAWWLNSPVVVAIKEQGKRNSEPAQKPSPWCHPLEKGVPRLMEIAGQMDSPINVQVFHWEKGGGFVNGDHFPPLSGYDGMERFFAMLHEKGHTGGVYIIPHKWTFKAHVTGYEPAPFLDDHSVTSIAVLDEEGRPVFSKWDWPWRKRVCVCMAEESVRASIVNDFRVFKEAGADYIQFDTFAGVTPVCHSEAHGHPSGMGAWQIDNSLSVIRDLRALGDYVLTYEAQPIPEMIPLSHGYVERGLHPLDQKGLTMIPLYQFMYHPYVQGFCGENCGDFNTPDNFFYINAITFVSGDLTMISLDMQGHVCMQTHEIDDYNQTVDDYCEESEIYAFLRRIGRLRRGAGRAFVSEGEMLRAPLIACACAGVLAGKAQSHEIPAVLGSTWQAKDGRVGTVLVNHTNGQQQIKVDLRTPAQAAERIIDNGQADRIELAHGIASLAVPARSALLLIHAEEKEGI